MGVILCYLFPWHCLSDEVIEMEKVNHKVLETLLGEGKVHIQWNPLMRTPMTHSTVRNIEASVFRRLPVIFPVGVAMSVHHAMAVHDG